MKKDEKPVKEEQMTRDQMTCRTCECMRPWPRDKPQITKKTCTEGTCFLNHPYEAAKMTGPGGNRLTKLDTNRCGQGVWRQLDTNRKNYVLRPWGRWQKEKGEE